MLARVSHAIDNLETDVSNGSLRQQPFCIVLYGFPGTGKSSFAIQIARALMVDKYGSFSSSDMVTLNETDEYQSEFRTSHKVVLFDDIGASKYGLADTKNPWRKVIDFVNNIRKTALNPNVEMKGKVYIEPDLVIITSNLDFTKGAAIGMFIPAVEAIFRRFNCMVRVVDHHSVCPAILDSSTQQISGGNVMTNLPQYREPCDLLSGSKSSLTSREDYIRDLIPKFRAHEQDQAMFVSQFNSYFDDYPDCPSDNLNLVAESDTVRDGFLLDSQSMNFPNKAPLPSVEDYKSEILSYTDVLPPVHPDADSEAHWYATIAYYLRKVKWEQFYVEFGDAPWFKEYVMSSNGVISAIPYWENKQFLQNVHHLEFEVAYNIVLDRHLSVPTDLVAESNSFIPNPIFATSTKNFDIPDDMEYEFVTHLKHRMDRCLLAPRDQRINFVPLIMVPYLDDYFSAPRKERIRVYAVFIAYLSFILDKSPDYVLNHPLWADNLPYMVKDMKERKKVFVLQLANDLLETMLAPDEPTATSILPESISIATDGSLSPVHCGSEAYQIDCLLTLINPYPKCQVHKNCAVGPFGEMDLVVFGTNSVIIGECKSSCSKSKRQLARQQVLRYSRMMKALFPERRIIGVTRNPANIRYVCDFGTSLPTEFEEFLDIIDAATYPPCDASPL